MTGDSGEDGWDEGSSAAQGSDCSGRWWKWLWMGRGDVVGGVEGMAVCGLMAPPHF